MGPRNLYGVNVEIKMVKVALDTDKETLARFSAVLSIEGVEVATFPDIRYAVRHDSTPKVVPPIHRKIVKKDPRTGKVKETIFLKCYYLSKPLLELILPEAEEAFKKMLEKKAEKK